MKEKLVLLFTDHEAEKVLNEQEIKACLEYLQKYVKPFQPIRMKRDILNVLIRKSIVVELESDENPFSHNIDQQDELSATSKYMRLSDQQFLYNKVKKASQNANGDGPKKTFKKIETAINEEEEDEYKPQLLNPTDIQVDMEASPSKMNEFAMSARSDMNLVPDENTKIGAIKSVPGNKKNDGEDEDLLNNDTMDNRINPILYIRGVPNDHFYLVLSGKVMICSGNEGFFLEQGPFNYMGVECLTNDNYVPDFSAKVIGKTKLLKISRVEYRKALAHFGNQA
jgi:hypothetical protein